MASITMRNLDEDLKRRLLMRTAEHGRSMEEEAQEILHAPKNLGQAIHARFVTIGARHAGLRHDDDDTCSRQ